MKKSREGTGRTPATPAHWLPTALVCPGRGRSRGAAQTQPLPPPCCLTSLPRVFAFISNSVLICPVLSRILITEAPAGLCRDAAPLPLPLPAITNFLWGNGIQASSITAGSCILPASVQRLWPALVDAGGDGEALGSPHHLPGKRCSGRPRSGQVVWGCVGERWHGLRGGGCSGLAEDVKFLGPLGHFDVQVR